MSEFAVIEKYFTRNGNRVENVLGVGDDAAILYLPSSQELVTSIDAFVESVHFLKNTDPFLIGYKALAVSVSDMAAMGATPLSCLLSLSLPSIDDRWLEKFSRGLFSIANQFNVDLVGGDISQGPLVINTVVQGACARGQAILRSGAKYGDDIYVSGTLGDAAAGLAILQQDPRFQSGSCDALVRKLQQPVPRVELGVCLRGIASAAIDISDGLCADLGKIINLSQVGGEIHQACLPLSDNLLHVTDEQTAISLALTAGDDYELCFTAPKNQYNRLQTIAAQLDCPMTRIGEIKRQEGLTVKGADGKSYPIAQAGFEHFKN